MSDQHNIAIEEILIGPDVGTEYLKQTSHAVIAVNAEAKIVLVNRSAELMFGYHKSELLGQKLEILLPDNLKDKHEHHRNTFMNQPRSRPMGIGLDLKAKHKNGNEISVDIHLIPVPNTKGMITIAEISKK